MKEPTRTISDCVFRGARFSERRFENLVFERCDFSGASFDRCAFDNLQLRECRFDDCRFDDCTAIDLAIFDGHGDRVTARATTLADINVVNGTWRALRLHDTRAQYLALTRCELDGLRVEACRIGHLTVHDMPTGSACFTGGELRDPVWFNCKLKDSSFVDMKIVRQVIGKTLLEHCVYRNVEGELATWYDCDLHDFLFQGPSFKRLSFHESRLRGCDLREAALDEAMFAKSTLSDCRLDGTHLNMAVFDAAFVERCRLDGSIASKSSWRGARIEHSQLPGARLDGADMRHVNIAWTDRRDAIFDGARMHGAQVDGKTVDAGQPGWQTIAAVDERTTASDAWNARHLGPTTS